LIHSIQMTTSKCGLSTIRLARRAKMAWKVELLRCKFHHLGRASI
jgi:hypothetical protein